MISIASACLRRHRPVVGFVGPILLAGTTLLSGAEPARAQSAPPSNVLIVLADDLGVDFVGAYGEGSDPAPTPTIDSLAAGGVLFRNAWANPSCSPTRACIMTGRYPFRTTVGRWIDYPADSDLIGTLRPPEVTLPEVLDLAGGDYAHGYIGKWHMSYSYQGLDVPNEAGWSHFAGKLKGMGGSDYYSWERVVNGVASTSNVYATTQQVDDALTWIGAQDRPWVCYLAFLAPHLPMHLPPSHLHTQDLSGQPITSTNHHVYKAVIEALDTELGRLFQGLGPEVMANTNVVFLGDNGSVQNMAVPPFLGGKAKGTPYEGGLNVPMIVSGPIVTHPGREIGDLVSAVDVFPTVLDLAGAVGALPAWVKNDGVSLVPYLDETVQSPLRSFVFSEEFTGNAWPAPETNGHATIRDDRYKLIRRVSKPDELYDLLGDPWEAANLLGGVLTAEQQQHHAQLLAEIVALRGNSGEFVPFGASTCIGSNGLVPQVTTGGAPTIGATYTVTVGDCLPFAPVVHSLGVDAIEWGGLPLPLDLSPFGTPVGCDVYVAPLFLSAVLTTGQGQATYSMQLPGASNLVGRYVFHQWMTVDPAAPGNSLGWVTSGAVSARIGQ